jgi:hypothetical protein
VHIKKYVFSLFIVGVMLFSINPITAFADSPDDMLNKGNRQMVWLNTESVLNSTTLLKDMKQEGVDLIVEYMKLYKE